jgi:transitional endoplasmic reticulum ATPase
VAAGHVGSTSVYRRPAGPGDGGLYPEDIFRFFFEQPAFGLQEIRLRVISTEPRGVVQVDAGTQIELMPEFTEGERAMRRTDVTYDDVGGIGEATEQVREMIELPLKHPELFQRLGIDPPTSEPGWPCAESDADRSNDFIHFRMVMSGLFSQAIEIRTKNGRSGD